MAGFLDKNTRVVDMVLTGLGRDLLSRGKLNFISWAAFDDEVDYVPFISTSGSLTTSTTLEAVLEHIECTPVREATTGYKLLNRSGTDSTNVVRPIFSMPQGSSYLPRMTASNGPTGSVSIQVEQQKISDLLTKKDQWGNVVEKMGPYDRGVQRFDTSTVSLTYGFTPGSYPVDYHPDGFLLKVFSSGAEGLVQITEARDMENRISYQNDLVIDLRDPSGT